MESPSLALKCKTVGEPSRCERVDYDWVNTETGEVRSGRCRATACLFCGPKMARNLVHLVERFGRPTRMVRLSQVHQSWQGVRSEIRDLRRRIRKYGYDWADMFIVEQNPKQTGFHAHMLQHGDYVPQDHLQQMCGGRIPYIARMRSGSATGYTFKGTGGMSYSFKGAASAEGLAQHLELNGGRLAHWSRNFFRNENGESMSKTAARKLLVSDWLESRGEELWQRVARSQASRSGSGSAVLGQ